MSRLVGRPQKERNRPRVVIVGAGFGGLAAARQLGRADVDLTVLDHTNHHLFQPLLYQVATAALAPSDITGAIRHILRRQRNTTVLLADAHGIDTIRRLVRCHNGLDVPYDYLILATGTRHSWTHHGVDFGYKTYPHDHVWRFENGVEVAQRVDPEVAFVAVLSSCHMLTFLGGT